MSEFINEAVRYHNTYRGKHGNVGDIAHNPELSAIAQAWADKLASMRTLKHSGATYKGQPLGENVASKWSSAGADYTGQEVVDQWYSESAKYNYSPTAPKQGTGHFSQVVWKGSKEMGIGKAKSPDGRVYVVANYFPAGNYVGQHAENVFPAA